MNNTAFEKDSRAGLGELFLKLRDYIKICIGNDVKERYNKKTTSFHTKDGGYCSIRIKDDYICIIWFKGSVINDKYNKLVGNQKVCRNQKVKSLTQDTRKELRYYIEETFIKLIEHNELKKIKNNMNRD